MVDVVKEVVLNMAILDKSDIKILLNRLAESTSDSLKTMRSNNSDGNLTKSIDTYDILYTIYNYSLFAIERSDYYKNKYLKANNKLARCRKDNSNNTNSNMNQISDIDIVSVDDIGKDWRTKIQGLEKENLLSHCIDVILKSGYDFTPSAIRFYLYLAKNADNSTKICKLPFYRTCELMGIRKRTAREVLAKLIKYNLVDVVNSDVKSGIRLIKIL